MATLSEITEGHSKRISTLTKLRDARLREAVDIRDHTLRALPAAKKLYETFDAQIAEARDRQLSTDAKAAAARGDTLEDASETLAKALAEAHRVRREADLAAFDKRRQAEEKAEHEFILAIGGSASQPTSTAAQQARAQKLAQAKKEFDAALAAAQEEFRLARDRALLAESQRSRDADR